MIASILWCIKIASDTQAMLGNYLHHRYKCPNGYMFATGEWPYWRANCTVQKEWNPQEAVPCVRRTCDSDPTAPFMGQGHNSIENITS